MSIYFDTAKKRLAENLTGFSLTDTFANGSNESAVFSDGKTNIKMLYAPELKRFYLFRGAADGCADDYTELQSYYFEPCGENDADIRDSVSVANEFAETVGLGAAFAPVVPASSRKASKKERETDEASAVYFVNRIPTLLPECRTPLLQHKQHYEMLLPNNFCAEVVNVAVTKMLKQRKPMDKIRNFFEFLDKMYSDGDLDVKSIITMTILNNITSESDIAFVEELISPELTKAWKSARRFIGKEVKPEKTSKYQQISQAYREQLKNQNR